MVQKGVILLFASDNPWQFIGAPSIVIVLGGTMAAIFLSYALREVLRVFHLVGQVLMNMVLDGISMMGVGRSPSLMRDTLKAFVAQLDDEIYGGEPHGARP